MLITSCFGCRNMEVAVGFSTSLQVTLLQGAQDFDWTSRLEQEDPLLGLSKPPSAKLYLAVIEAVGPQ